MDPIRFVRRSLATALVFAGCVAPSLTPSTAFAAPRCEAPKLVVDRRACDKAKEGPDALRQFVTRTQSIHMLYFWDYVLPSDLERHFARQHGAPLGAQGTPDERAHVASAQ